MNNDVLSAVALMEGTYPMLNENNRAQISRSVMEVLSKHISMVIERIKDKGNQFQMISFKLVGLKDLIMRLLSDNDFSDTDEETKKSIIDSFKYAQESLYMAAGRYYEGHDFDFAVGMDELVQRIIIRCINGGYYFGKA